MSFPFGKLMRALRNDRLSSKGGRINMMTRTLIQENDMNHRSHRYCLISGIAAGSLALGTAAANPVSPVSVTITVLEDQFAVDERGFASLQALESHLESIKPQALRVQACGPSSIARWKAVVHRFRNLPIEPRVLDPRERDCSPARPLAIHAAGRAGQSAADIDDVQVNRYWQELIP